MTASPAPSRTTTALKRSAIAAAALLIGFCLFFSWTSWQGAKKQEAYYLAAVAELSGNSLDAYFRHYENALRPLSDELLDATTADKALRDFKRANPDLLSVSLLLPSGQMIASTAATPADGMPSYADSASFRAAREALLKGETFDIGRPFVGTLDPEWLLPLRLALRDAHGELVLIVSCTLPLARQQSFWQDMTLPANTALGILRDDGFLVSRFPTPKKMNYEEAYGKPRDGALMDHLRQVGFPARGHTEGYNSVAKADYVFAYRRLPRYPLTLFVSTPIDNIRAKWWQQMQFAYALLALALAGGYAIYRWALRRQAEWDREKAASDARFEFLAHHDPLTELPNRLLVKERLRLALAYAERTNRRVAVMFVDLDHFKTINDSLGHPVGDSLLRAVAERLRHCIRETDTLSRLGGDEFMIVLSDLGATDDIAAVAEKIVAALGQTFAIDGNQLSTSLSIGIAVAPDDGADFDTLMKKADIAMYKAKESGRNTYRFFTGQMNFDADEHLRIVHWLRQALEEQHFVLHYQPQFDLADGRLVGAEALLRLQHPEAGLIPPGRFVPLAEDSGLIVPIGKWVLNEACRQAAAWHRSGAAGLVVAVNLSAVQFRRADLFDTVAAALNDSGLPAECLELELTESILIADTDNVLASVRSLKQLGVRFSIDDFGTGYSSLAYLKRFDVDKLKIDQSFVRELPGDANSAVIVEAIVRMASSLGLKTIAEGVEDEASLAFLRAQGCDEVQGYHFGRPQPADEFQTRFIAGGRAPAAASTAPQDVLLVTAPYASSQ